MGVFLLLDKVLCLASFGKFCNYFLFGVRGFVVSGWKGILAEVRGG
jgi:hypothetical protein